MSKTRENKPHIGIFGLRNRGKSSLINMLGGQDIAIVSDVAGTTTDPVKKSMEISGIGPVVLVDTAGLDDVGDLGKKRTDRSLRMLDSIDLALLVVAENILTQEDEAVISLLQQRAIPSILIHNKADLLPAAPASLQEWTTATGFPSLNVSALENTGREELKQLIRETLPPTAWQKASLLGDLLSYGDLVLLITPIDIEAPEGRMILPQVQAIRDILDNDAIAVVVKERELDELLKKLQPRPALAVTDSQIFLKADASIPRDIPLTSFSIMLARFKGDFEQYLKGTPAIDQLKDGDKVLILESCTHHVSCDDIGRTKIPRWLANYTGKQLDFEVVAGMGKPREDIREYALVVQCGGCVITRRQVINRVREAVEAGIPVTNYGMAIAWMHGMYERAVAPFTRIEKDSVNYL